MKQIFWNSGLNNFKQNELVIGDQSCDYILTLQEEEFEPNRTIDTILYDHLKNRQTKTVELLYSGGADSELVLKSCIQNKIPIIAYTMKIRAHGALLNVVDIYYAEKFCRENSVKQIFFELDANDFFQSGKYLTYLENSHITEPHVATHFWLLEKCNSFPIIGGDWPWVQQYKNVLSPFKLSYNSYEIFMKKKKIEGIGNMLSHSFESICYFLNKQIYFSQYSNVVPILKQKMYMMDEPRIRSYGWEYSNLISLSLHPFKAKLLDLYKKQNSKIVWGENIKQLINSETNANDKFF